MLDDEVIFLAVRTVEVNINRNLELLVVRLIEQVDITYDTHHTLALLSQLLDVNVVTFIVHHIILLEEYNHLIQGLAVNDIVIQLLIIVQRTVIHSDVADGYVCIVRYYRDINRCFLSECISLRELHRTRQFAIHEQFEQSVARFLVYHEGNLVAHIRSELGAYLRSCCGSDSCFLRSQLEAYIFRKTAHHDAVSIGHVTGHDLHLQRTARGGEVCGKWLIPDSDFGTIGKIQRITIPSVTAPVEALEGCADALIVPFSWVLLRVCTSDS